MTTWIALLRGVNVGGHRKLPMAELRDLASGLGLESPRTYIQSGNLVFTAAAQDPDALGEKIAAAIEVLFGFSAPVWVLSREELGAAMAANPFPDAEPNRLHLWFLTAPAAPDPAAIDAHAAPDERWALVGRVLYLHAPSGIGRSKLAAGMERLLGVEATARNWRTMTAVAGLAED